VIGSFSGVGGGTIGSLLILRYPSRVDLRMAGTALVLPGAGRWLRDQCCLRTL
jgi:hypothetical protein